jgi:hypothetical protein
MSEKTLPERLEGWIPPLATEDEIRAALEQAFDYRGDITITKRDGVKVEGYLFDRRTGKSLADPVARVLPEGTSDTVTIPYAEIAALAFTGRDTAAGKSWEAWVRKYYEKRAAGEHGFGLDPEPLDG